MSLQLEFRNLGRPYLGPVHLLKAALVASIGLRDASNAQSSSHDRSLVGIIAGNDRDQSPTSG